MWADVIVEVDASGERRWEWRAAERLDPGRYPLAFNDHRSEWTHGNTVVPLGDDRVLASFRNISTIAIIDKATGRFEWELGPEVLAQQHDPSLLENGNILVLDNGAHRGDNPLPFSRVLEIAPAGNEIVWSYQDPTPYAFFSAYISGARRLPNGNTLITEGLFGRMFQVTPEGEVVWEYTNPHFHPHVRGYDSNGVFRASHVPPGAAAGLP
jgi:outer membrane protein assembly factor BamB